MKLKLMINWNIITWLYVIPFRDLEEDFNVMDQPDDLTLVRPSRSGAMTAIGTARRSLTARRSMYSAPIAVTIAVTSRFGRYDRYSPTVTQGVVAGLRPNWYNLFQVALQAYFLSVQDEKICVI
ncbi:hypothetical protein L249_4470 [Ophiocordyceps polyrhachis-furcata BCC 54312]|uniref:Uncharacterized protein n=1 Tax=Ophiocordyceps polyrhachis-furcata BCC 54312 TaxID=1330021 RepID=A0A367L7S3_9HYPO|nr:hypothetical protein L249_4470 [Ophiocordyceps polyrhachis-furcata BCC 54312]